MIKRVGHTPGPWIAVGRWVECLDDSSPDVCSCAPESMGQDGRSDAECCANARLIAAAPALLEALRLLLSEVIFDGTAGTEMARVAIASAVGGAT